MNKLILNLGYGRSGTTFLFNLCQENFPNLEIWHEKISAREARRAALFRIDNDELLEEARRSEHVKKFVAQAKDVLRCRPLIVLGGTTSHLAPLLL